MIYPRSGEEDFKRYTSILQQIRWGWFGGGGVEGLEIYNFSSPYPTYYYIQNLAKIRSVVFKTRGRCQQPIDNAHYTSHDDRCQPRARGHLSDSGDLKIRSMYSRTFPNFSYIRLMHDHTLK